MVIVMLGKTFIHFPNIGPISETKLWSEGVNSWEDIYSGNRSTNVDTQLKNEASISIDRLKARDAAYFQAKLPSREMWRTYPEFVNEAIFLDIETTGLSSDNSYVTLVGILDRDGFTAYTRGDNLDDLPQVLQQYRLVVTFNGASFDLPFLENHFGTEPDSRLFGHMLHIDLRYPLQRAGYRGGLKKIEQMTGLGRSSALDTLSGADAVALWHMANTGEPGAMETLIRYNAEDVASLPKLAARAFDELSSPLPVQVPKAPRLPDFDTSVIPYDEELIRYVARVG